MRSAVLCQYSWFLVFGFRGCCFLFCYGFNGLFLSFTIHRVSIFKKGVWHVCVDFKFILSHSGDWKTGPTPESYLEARFGGPFQTSPISWLSRPCHHSGPPKKMGPRKISGKFSRLVKCHDSIWNPDTPWFRLTAGTSHEKKGKWSWFTKPPGNCVCHVNLQRCIICTDIPESSQGFWNFSPKKPTKTKPGGPHHSTCKTQPATQTLQDPTLGLHLKLGHQAEGGWIDEWRVSEDMKIFLGPVKVLLLGWLVG